MTQAELQSLLEKIRSIDPGTDIEFYDGNKVRSGIVIESSNWRPMDTDAWLRSGNQYQRLGRFPHERREGAVYLAVAVPTQTFFNRPQFWEPCLVNPANFIRVL